MAVNMKYPRKGRCSMTKRGWNPPEKIYAAYRGDEYIGEGTIAEIADMAGVSCATAKWGRSLAAKKRQEMQKGNRSKGMLLLVLVEGEEGCARRERQLLDKPCRECGKMMHQVDYMRKYCDDCLKEHERKKYARREAQYKTLCRKKRITYREARKLPLAGVDPYDPNASTRTPLDDNIRAAREAGVSYGQYMAKKRMAKGEDA